MMAKSRSWSARAAEPTRLRNYFPVTSERGFYEPNLLSVKDLGSRQTLRNCRPVRRIEVQQWQIKINSAYPRFPGQNDARPSTSTCAGAARTRRQEGSEVARSEPRLADQGPRVAEQRRKRLRGDAAGRPARRVLPHPSRRRNGDCQIKLAASGVDFTQWFGVTGKSQDLASKAALDGLARSWAIELASSQITVNVVAPGPIESSTLADPARSATPPKLPPFGRCVQPEEVADQVAFLLGPIGCSITGQWLVICAGASL
jgi:NAD(P)-dependent dehydrogenase (short-subunit alcohol dehydrogenase family)